jgi:hypothetical protein
VKVVVVVDDEADGWMMNFRTLEEVIYIRERKEQCLQRSSDEQESIDASRVLPVTPRWVNRISTQQCSTAQIHYGVGILHRRSHLHLKRWRVSRVDTSQAHCSTDRNAGTLEAREYANRLL